MKKTAKINEVSNSKRHSDGPKRQTVQGGASLRFWQHMIGAAFLCLLLVAVAMFRVLPAPGNPAVTAASTPLRRASAHSINHYFQSGQWRADMHTLASLFHYLMTPDSVTTVTNRPVMPA